MAVCAFATPCPAPAQSPEAARNATGNWELSNADRDKTCGVTLRLDPKPPGYRIDLERTCAPAFPLVRDVTAWGVAVNDAIQFLDSGGRTVIDFTEVESGLYEGLKPGTPLLFLQSAATVGTERKPEQMLGDWGVVRGAGNAVCVFTLLNTVVGDGFALRAKPGCDASISRIGHSTWRLQQGQLALGSAKGEVWRFEESEPMTWRRVPESRPPMMLVKQ